MCDCYVAMAETALQQQKYEQAIGLVNQALAMDITHVSAQTALGKVYKMRAENWVTRLEFDKAIDDFTKVFEIQPSDDEALAQRGACYLASGKHEEALRDFKKAIEMNANNEFAITLYGDFLKNEGMSLFNEGNLQEAVDFFTQYLHINPRDFMVWMSRGECFRSLNKLDEEKQNFVEAIKFNPDQLDLRLRHGLCAFRTKNYEEAHSNFSYVNEKDPSNVLAWLLKGQVYQAQRSLSWLPNAFLGSLRSIRIRF